MDKEEIWKKAKKIITESETELQYLTDCQRAGLCPMCGTETRVVNDWPPSPYVCDKCAV
jgi:hypothetical protein